MGQFVRMGVLLAAVAFVGEARANQINWQPDLQTAMNQAAATNRLLLVHFWAPTCGPCMRLESEVFSRPETATALNNGFICVKVNVDEQPAIARQYNVTMWPTDVLLSPAGKPVYTLRCPQDANKYVQQLNSATTAYHRFAGTMPGEASGMIAQAAQMSAAPANPYAAVPPANSAPAVPSVPQTAPPVVTMPSAPANPTYGDDRYAEYLRNHQAEAPTAPPAADMNAAGQTSRFQSRYSTAAAPTQEPQVPAQAPIAPPAYQQPAPPVAAYPPQVPAASNPMQQRVAAVQPQSGNPPLAMEGYCVVQLKEQKRWVLGDRRFGAVHRGCTYLFTGPEEQQKFLANPDSYSPVMSGNDPVLALDQGLNVPGSRQHGVFYENRIYLFADEASLQRFYQNKTRYAAEVYQAMR